jgi:hypothetical protein
MGNNTILYELQQFLINVVMIEGMSSSNGVVLSASDDSSISVFDPQVLLPISIAIAAIFLAVAGFCYCWRRSKLLLFLIPKIKIYGPTVLPSMNFKT